MKSWIEVTPMHKALVVLNIAVRAGFIILGVLMLLGMLTPGSVPAQFRVMMGVVFILYGSFRLATMRARTRPSR